MAGDFKQVVAEVCQRYAAVGKPVNWNLANQPVFGFRSMAIRRLVTNLVDNAASYGRGQIEVSTRYDESSVILTVRDEGPGIRSTDPNNLIKARS
jgi:two-component system, OmpR family, osmolarity sensor histidine kinase EnvZ